MLETLGAPQAMVAAAAGVCLAAAVGFRIFAPMLVVALAAKMGHLPLAGGFEWLGTDLAVIMLGVAAAAETAAYFIPYFDHLLDVLAGPVAVAAGTLLMASTLVETAPWLRWAFALIAGGGTAGLVHAATSGLRLGSTATTGGLGNPILAGVELSGSVVLALLAIILPIAALIVLVVLLVRSVRRLRRAF